MKTGKTFKQIFIESEDDLPKENGEYLVQSGFGTPGRDPYTRIFDVNSSAHRKFWILYIDWYLLELSEPTQPENQTNFMQIRDLTDEEWLRLPKEEILQLYKNCYTMLEDMIKSRDKIQPLPGNRKTAEENIIELLNKYTTTSVTWCRDARINLLIDPMDYHKLAKEISSECGKTD